MTASVLVEHPDGSQVFLPHIASEREEEFGKLSQARITTTLNAAKDAELEEGDDEVYLDTGTGESFGGVLRDVKPGSSEATLVVDSFERYAIDAEPTPGGNRWANVADSVVVQDAIDGVPQLTAGTVENVKSGLSFLFSHSSRAKQIRTVADATGAMVRYTDSKTVDYVSRIGTDRSEVLTPGNQRIVDNIRVERKGGGGETANHLRMLGAGEGTHQRSAEVVDPDYDASVDREKWRVYANKDMTDAATLQEQGNELLGEFADRWTEVEATVRNIDPPLLGDTFPVEVPRRDVDDRFSVVQIVRKLSDDGLEYDLTLSSRVLARERESEKSRKDVKRYNKAVQGTAVPINASGGRQPVDSSHNYRMKLYYPGEVEYEHRLNVRVVGLPYRAYSKGVAAGGGSTETSTATAGATLTDTLSTGYSGATSASASETIPAGAVNQGLFAMVDANPDSGTVTRLVVEDTSASEVLYDVAIDGTNNRYVAAVALDSAYTDRTGNTIEATAHFSTSTSGTMDITVVADDEHSHDLTIPDHTHPAQAGIIESFSGTTHYPSNCDVLVNGTSQGVSFGDGTGEFADAVDISGELNEGQMNTIEVTSDSLGHVTAYVEGDVYRQILGNG